MRITLLQFAGIAFVLLAIAVWWFALDSRAPAKAEGVVPLDTLRAAIAADPVDVLPQSVELYRVGSGEAPMFAVEAGGGFSRFRMAYTAFGLTYADGTRIMVDAAVDRETAASIGDSKAAKFDDATYDLLLDRIASAQRIVLTHEHKDHVMALVRNPHLPDFVDNAWLPAKQNYGLQRSVLNPAFGPIIEARSTQALDSVVRIGPGIAIAPTPGHSPGSLTVYTRLQDGTEYLFTGDIAWSFQDIERVKTRPRFLQWIMFDPREERERVLAQLRALHDLHRAEPDLVVVPSHDDRYFDTLLEDRKLTLPQP
jgi:glyoxylase-like metal-dependent hydrolase (beta-lactamase superfamily II)